MGILVSVVLETPEVFPLRLAGKIGDFNVLFADFGKQCYIYFYSLNCNSNIVLQC